MYYVHDREDGELIPFHTITEACEYIDAEPSGYSLYNGVEIDTDRMVMAYRTAKHDLRSVALAKLNFEEIQLLGLTEEHLRELIK